MSSEAYHLAVLQVVVPLLSAPLIILLRPRGLAWAAATAASAMAFAVAVMLTAGVLSGIEYRYAVGGWPAPYGIEIRVDALTSVALLVVSGASLLALFAGRRSLDGDIDEARQPLFYGAWMLALAGLCGIVVSADAFNIFVFMEVSSLASYVLIAAGPNRRALAATFKYLVMGTIGATFYLIGVGLIYMMTGTLNLADMAQRISEVADQRPILAAGGFIIVGLALKAAVLPLHAWLPNAYTYAPHIVTVFLAACATKVQIYVMLRFDFLVFQGNLTDHDLQFSRFLMPLALLAIVLASGVAMMERNLKRLLAYSSVAQIGYIMLGTSLLSAAGLSAGIIHIFNHALAKGALFLAVAGLGMHYQGLRLDQLAGAAKRMPWTMAAFVLAGLSLIGLPGTAGFVSKWLLISAALAEGSLGIVLVAVVLLGSLMAVVYVWRVVEAAYFRAPQQAVADQREAPPMLLAATWAAVLANIYFGLQPGLPVQLSQAAAASLLQSLP
ncbi:monovalent cation/H+ antiporter subunit D family protein [Pelagibius sp. CAU 1746]|uniref:monovalent cation/H+ antiporter subunit D family protein n=1 Tax=Pelagibius sp. CAU 1746 TaxID=3140370 RepID=UPI00325AD186